MASQNYEVIYEIRVNASDGTQQVRDFADAVEKLNKGRLSFTPVVNNINEMMAGVEKIFRGKNGKKKDFNFELSIKTGECEAQLTKIEEALTRIKELAKDIKLTINPGAKIDSRSLRSQAKKVIEQGAANPTNDGKQTASAAVQEVMAAQQRITKAIGKVNAALVHLEKGREIHIETDVAKARLEEIFSLLNRIKGATKMTLGIGMGSPGSMGHPSVSTWHPPLNYAPLPMPVLSEKEQAHLDKRLYTDQLMGAQRIRQAQEKSTLQVEAFRRMTQIRSEERAERQRKAEEHRRMQANERLKQQNAAQMVHAARRQAIEGDNLYGSKRRAAINRIQYSKAPSLRNLPLANMLNAYMAYHFMRSQFTQAVEYSNVMQTAHSILSVADSDLSTFESRFDRMARYVRRIGVETKFTAIEVAGAVKYLSMAGMGIETINASIRPITDLALIGDNDISQIADLVTNIQTGYNVKDTSMGSVADILASTVSRSNVNIIETAESFKMASGYLRLAGVDFTEAAAAIGTLGNMGVKGTMSGTALRAMATRFAKPTKQAQDVLNRLGIKFTRMEDVYGKQVERLKPLADIFQELHEKGASMSDIQTLFGKIGGNAAMMFVTNYKQLRTLASQNRASQGISSDLAQVKQDTTKGLWYQVTSQLSETFMRGYELMEPVIRGRLKDFLAKFDSREFARGLASIGQTLVNLLSALGNVAAWFTRNFHWLEPILFTGFVGSRLYKLAGALTNVGVAIGFIGKQAGGNSVMELVSGLTGLISSRGIKTLSFANKRAVVTALQAAGISGKGAMSRALMKGGGSLAARLGFSSLFSSQVAVGGGFVGATSSLSALGAGAVAATAGITGLIGALGWVAYKTWQVKKAKDAVTEEVQSNEKYRYKSIEDLYSSLRKTYQQAIDTRKAVEEVTSGKTVEESSGQKIGAFTGSWWSAFFSSFASASEGGPTELYSFSDARQEDARSALEMIARRDSQSRVNAAFAEFGKLSDALQVRAFIDNIAFKYGQKEASPEEVMEKTGLKKPLWERDRDGKIIYSRELGELPEYYAAYTPHYARYQNETTVRDIRTAAEAYLAAIENMSGARKIIKETGFDYDELLQNGFTQDEKGEWKQQPLGAQATDSERQAQLKGNQRIHFLLVNLIGTLRQRFGGSAEAAENILRKAGFSPSLYSNEPDSKDNEPFNANRITGASGGDDWGAGGNYSGTSKLSGAVPRQVIVNIDNLMSVETIDLMKSPEGQAAEIKNFKEMLAQALIDVVHDFNSSWNY